jgi:hypothetical protein
MLSTKNIRQLLLSGIAVSTLLLTAAFVDNSRYFELIKNISLYAEVYKTLNDDYVDNIEPAATMRKGIEAMLKTLDPLYQLPNICRHRNLPPRTKRNNGLHWSNRYIVQRCYIPKRCVGRFTRL